MPITTTCPQCAKPLRVPDDLIGQAVRCPACATEWHVAEPAPSPPDGVPSPRPEEQWHVTETPGERQALAPPLPPPSLDDDPGEDDDDDEEFERNLDERFSQRRERRYLQDAKSKLMGPAIGMFVVSALLFLAAMFRVAHTGFMVYTFSAMPAGPGAPPAAYSFGFVGAMLVYSLVLFALAGTTLYGGIQLLRVRRWGWCLAACICAMIPNCECCFVIGIPFGVWGIVMLVQQDVKEAFRRPVETRRQESGVRSQETGNEE